MSTNPSARPPQAGADAGAAGQPSEEELRAAYEAELSRITSADMMLQAAVTLLNIAGYRLGAAARTAPAGPAESADAPGGERDLEQVRDAIDGVKALLEILERRLPAELGPLRDALAQLQIAYAREVKAAAADSSPAPADTADEQQGRPDAEDQREEGAESSGDGPSAQDPPAAGEKRPGPAEASGRLWVPGR